MHPTTDDTAADAARAERILDTAAEDAVSDARVARLPDMHPDAPTYSGTPARAERSSASRIASDLRALVRHRVREACLRDVASVIESAARGEYLAYTADATVARATAGRDRLAASCASIAIDHRLAATAAADALAVWRAGTDAQPGDVLLDALCATEVDRRLVCGVAQEVACALRDLARAPRAVELRPGEVSDALEALERIEGPSRPMRALAILAAILEVAS